jgi:hypothetical protein
MLYSKTMVQHRYSNVIWNIMTLSDGCLLVQIRTSRNRASPLWTWSMLNASPLRRTMTCIKVSQHEDIHLSSAFLYVAIRLQIYHATSFMHPARSGESLDHGHQCSSDLTEHQRLRLQPFKMFSLGVNAVARRHRTDISIQLKKHNTDAAARYTSRMI